MELPQQNQKRKIQGGIYIEIPKTKYFSGEEIEGIILVNLEENYCGKILQISLLGIEETFYSYVESANQEVNMRKTSGLIEANGKNKFIDFSIPVYDFSLGKGGQSFVITPGQWQVPFNITVANKLPSSIKVDTSDGSTKCSLKYQLCASIIPFESSIQPLQCVQDIQIAQKFESDKLINTNQKSHRFTSKSNSSCGELQFLMYASTDKNIYSPGETIKVTYFTNLIRQHTVSSFKLTLKGQLELKTHLQHKKKKIKILEIEQIIPLKGKQVKETIEIEVPQSAQITSEGNLINYQYFLKISPKVDKICFVFNDKMTGFVIPIILKHSLPQISQNIYPKSEGILKPEKWNPIIIKPIIFTPQQAAEIQEQQLNYQISQQEQITMNNDTSQLMGNISQSL